ncbi:hypothetical protein MLGJGCBP_08643 [Rhodococcus sp. T7]|nr:hypothetical protein MLGJGCBP_08643 [Rhodococcus sp. T7]
MAVEASQFALFEPLTRQKQVNVQRAAEPADGDEEVRELGLLTEQFGEFVDDDEQCGQRVEVGTGLAGLLVFGDVREVPGGAQEFLASIHLTGEGVPHPVDHREFLGEVGDHRGDVRRVLETEERGAALEVDEDEVERVG